MPITKSAQKAHRQSIRRKKQNTLRKEAYKTALKNIKKAVEKKDLEEAKKLLGLAYKALDKAAKKNTIKKNKAARLKSRITKMVNRQQPTNV